MEHEKPSPPNKEGCPPRGRGGQPSHFFPKESIPPYNPTHNNLPQLKKRRKSLRNHMTHAEVKLWLLLKGKQFQGRKFRRQFSVGPYILDFYCPAERLAIELDGAGHAFPDQIKHDKERDTFIQSLGIRILRFENKWVWENPIELLLEIEKTFGWFLPTTTESFNRSTKT